MLATGIIDSSHPPPLNDAAIKNMKDRVAEIKCIWNQCVDGATKYWRHLQLILQVYLMTHLMCIFNLFFFFFFLAKFPNGTINLTSQQLIHSMGEKDWNFESQYAFKLLLHVYGFVTHLIIIINYSVNITEYSAVTNVQTHLS